MARITLVNKAAKDAGPCGRCGTEIKKGDPYRHATPGFRGTKKIRCMDPGCAFRQSELTTSLMADVYAAQEGAESDLANAATLEDIVAALEACSDNAMEVAQAYTDAAEAMGGAGEEMQEKADLIESWCDELTNFDIDEYKTEIDDESVPEGEELETEEDMDAAIDAARELIGSLEA